MIHTKTAIIAAMKKELIIENKNFNLLQLNKVYF